MLQPPINDCSALVSSSQRGEHGTSCGHGSQGKGGTLHVIKKSPNVSTMVVLDTLRRHVGIIVQNLAQYRPYRARRTGTAGMRHDTPMYSEIL